jgi:DNA-binding MurR/RpiR family transcriptional regulator
MSTSNRHPVDELADIRSEIKRLTVREEELRRYLLEHPNDREGDDYVVSIASQSRKRVDLKRLADEIGVPPATFHDFCQAPV